MTCVLKELNDQSGTCEMEGCVYWAVLSGPGEQPHRGCALAFYGLVGPQRDRLATWLLDFKLKDQTVRHSEVSLTDAYASKARARAKVCSTMGRGYVPRRDRLPSSRSAGVAPDGA